MTVGYVSAVVLSARSVLAGAMTAGSIAVAYSYMSNTVIAASHDEALIEQADVVVTL